MSIGDFLYQAGFWQWIGMICMAGAIGQFRFVEINKTKENKEAGE